MTAWFVVALESAGFARNCTIPTAEPEDGHPSLPTSKTPSLQHIPELAVADSPALSRAPSLADGACSSAPPASAHSGPLVHTSSDVSRSSVSAELASPRIAAIKQSIKHALQLGVGEASSAPPSTAMSFKPQAGTPVRRPMRRGMRLGLASLWGKQRRKVSVASAQDGSEHQSDTEAQRQRRKERADKRRTSLQQMTAYSVEVCVAADPEWRHDMLYL